MIYVIISAIIAAVALFSFICGLASGSKFDRGWNDGNTKKAERFMWAFLYWTLGVAASVILAGLCGALWPAALAYLAKERFWPAEKKSPT